MQDITAILLAAGRSSRMGRLKALLPCFSGDGNANGVASRTAIELICDRLNSACFRDVVVVLGYGSDQILPLFTSRHERIILNSSPEHGQISSLVAGLDQVNSFIPSILVALVDHPFVRIDTYRLLREAALRSPNAILIPTFSGDEMPGRRRGHPVVFPASLFHEFRNAHLEEGARSVVRRHTDCIVELPVDDPGILCNMNETAEYHAALAQYTPAWLLAKGDNALPNPNSLP